MGIRMLAGRAADLELACEDLEVVKRRRRQEQLLAQDPERKGWPLVPPQHPRSGHAVRLEQVGHRDAERLGHPPERFDAGARPAALDLAQEALAEPRARGNRPEVQRRKRRSSLRRSPTSTSAGTSGALEGIQISLDPVEGKLKPPYGVREVESMQGPAPTVTRHRWPGLG